MAKSYTIGGRNYTFDEFLRALDMLDARQNQYGYTVTNPLEAAAMEENLGGQPFSFDPRSGQFVRNPNTTQQQRKMLGDIYGDVGGTGAPGQQSFMSLLRPEGYWTTPTLPGEESQYMGKGYVPVSTSSSEVQRFLGLPPETQKLIGNFTPEQYYALKKWGGETVEGVRDESGLTPPGATGEEGPALGQTVGEWLKEQRGKQRTYHKPAEISAERQAALKLAGQGGLEAILRAMAGRGLSALDAVNRLGQKGLLAYGVGGEAPTGGYTPFANQPGTPWQNIVPPSAVPPPKTDTAAYRAWQSWWEVPSDLSTGGRGYWLNQAETQYSDLLKERANQIASERLIPFERAQKLAIKQMRAPTSGAYAGSAMSSTWK